MLRALRECHARQNGLGIVVQIGSTTEHLSWAEALELFGSLMKSLPHIPDRIICAWDMRHAATVRVRAHFTPNTQEQKVERTAWVGEVCVLGKCILRTDFCPSVATAVLAAREAYGDDALLLTEVYDCPGSEKCAQEQLVYQVAAQYAAEQGISLEELLRMAHDAS